MQHFDQPAHTSRERKAFDYRHRPLVMAHRGGGALWPENTLHAFTEAVALGADVLEMDVHAAADGEIIVIHDHTVERTTDGTGRVNALTLAELKRLDAGYRFTPDNGRSFPFRGRGLSVPTLREVLNAFPGVPLNIDIKQVRPSLVDSLCRLLRECGAVGRTTIASFNSSVLEEFRAACGEVATSASEADVRAFLALKTGNTQGALSRHARALQVPEYAGARHVLTREFVAAAHGLGLEVHAWTINDTEAMRRLIALGVDGIITGYPNRLMDLLKAE